MSVMCADGQSGNQQWVTRHPIPSPPPTVSAPEALNPAASPISSQLEIGHQRKSRVQSSRIENLCFNVQECFNRHCCSMGECIIATKWLKTQEM